MRFKEIIGQENAKHLLRDMAAGGRMPHALLLLCAPGSGGLALSLAMAQLLNCEKPVSDPESGEKEPCERCYACIKTGKWIHPDLHFSYPTVGAKEISTRFLKQWRAILAENTYFSAQDWLDKLDAGNSQGNITRDECAEIVKKLSLKPFEAKKKILVMWLPEYLGKEGNRLLKIIEEPPDDTIFILVAENPDLILNTILSRCQLIKVPQLQDTEIANALITKGLESDEAHAIARLADGSWHEAVRLSKETANDNAQSFLFWMRKCFVGNGVELVRWTESFSKKGREKQKLFLKYGLHFLREVLILKMTDGLNEDLPPRLRKDELETAQKMKTVLDIDKIQGISRLFDECIYHVERNANPKVLFLDASIRTHRILRAKIANT
jgi:DNA polymerase-3 subunit delta'